ncbi:hypothetical protein BHU11_10345 [Tannerella sp. oral taxon 808]|nr:hypothetical protein BHU11_10345 [Tannerella sp. oral taxon 808]
MHPPITYYGGKQKMLRHILPLIPPHRIYNEPFFGGGAVFWAKEPAYTEFINDINGEVVNFYRVLKTDFPAFKRELDGTLHSELQHREARAIYRSPEEHTPVRRAWAFWVLSMESMFHIVGNTWTFRKSGRGRLPHEVTLGKELLTEAYAARLEMANIFSGDAVDIICRVDRPNAFHYVDPPYFKSDQGHYKGYTEADFTRLLDRLTEVKGRFLLSSYPSEVLTRYTAQNGWHTRTIVQNVGAGHVVGKRKTEVLTMNYDPAELATASPQQLNLSTLQQQ